MVGGTWFKVDAEQAGEVDLNTGGGRARPLERPDHEIPGIAVPDIVAVDKVTPEASPYAFLKHSPGREVHPQPPAVPDIIAYVQRYPQIMEFLP